MPGLNLGDLDGAKVLMLRSLKLDMSSFKSFNRLVERYFNLGLVYGELECWDSCFYLFERAKYFSASEAAADLPIAGRVSSR